LKEATKKIISIYNGRGFKIEQAIMDKEFEPIRGHLADMQVGLNVAGRNEHVPKIESYIRTVKKSCRAAYSTLPFSKIPAILVIEMVDAAVFWLNTFPYLRGVSKVLSPRTIITGQTISSKKHCKYSFGEYVQTHEEYDNTMASRTVNKRVLFLGCINDEHAARRQRTCLAHE
jgi:hypothetical protein